MNEKLYEVNCANLIENECIIIDGCTWSLRYILELNEAINPHDRCYVKCMGELLSKSRWNMLILTEFGLLLTWFAFCWWYTKWRILGFLIGMYMAFWVRRFSSLVREVISNKFFWYRVRVFDQKTVSLLRKVSLRLFLRHVAT